MSPEQLKSMQSRYLTVEEFVLLKQAGLMQLGG